MGRLELRSGEGGRPAADVESRAAEWRLVLSLDGQVEAADERAFSELELKPDAVIGAPFVALWPRSIASTVADALAQARAGGVGRMRCWRVTPAETTGVFEVRISPIPGPAGGAERLLAACRNVSSLGEKGRAVPSLLTSRPQSDLFEASFAHSAVAKTLVGMDGRILEVNQAYRQLTGYTEAELVGRQVRSITHPDDRDVDGAGIACVVAGKLPHFRREKRYLRADGSEVWVDMSVSLARDADGRPTHFIAEIQDLTARREAEARYRLLAEHVGDVVSLHNMEGRPIYMSPSSERLLGYAPEEIVGGAVPQQDLFVDRAELAGFANLAPGETRLDRFRMRHRSGRILVVECAVSRVRDDSGAPLTVLVTRDVTQKAADEEALARASEGARAAAAAKAAFVANMSHEIRTPLTSVLGFVHLLAQRDDLPEEANLQVRQVSSAGRALLTVVNDILDFSKLEAGQFQVVAAPADPVEAARDALLMFQSQADEKGLALELRVMGTVPPQVVVDVDRVRQVLLNLIGNAVKFTDVGQVTVRLRYQGGRLRVAVEDTGPGVRPADQSRLFKRFSQAGGASRRSGGTGLGLAICKGLVEAMGGRIGVRSEPGKGACFQFSVPAEAADAALPPPEDPSVRMIDGVAVLVVDDNPANRELVRAVLEAVGAEVSDVANGPDALSAVQERAFDVILMDLRMPGMDGLEALRRIRAASGPNQRTPVVAFSADVELERGSQGGFSASVGKPLDPLGLINTIAECANRVEPAVGRSSAS